MSTLLYSTLLYSTLLYSTLLYSTLLYSTLLYSTLLYSTILNFYIDSIQTALASNMYHCCRFPCTPESHSLLCGNIIHPDRTAIRTSFCKIHILQYWIGSDPVKMHNSGIKEVENTSYNFAKITSQTCSLSSNWTGYISGKFFLQSCMKCFLPL